MYARYAQNVDTIRAFQGTEIDGLIADLSPEYKEIALRSISYAGDGLMSAILIRSGRFHGNLRLHMLPSTTRNVYMQMCGQPYPIETRLLPRALVSFDMAHNALFGSLNLQTLPEKLKDFSVQGNKITGPIMLDSLPRTLKSLNLSANAIREETVLYKNLPQSLRLVNLRGNKIKEVKDIGEKDAQIKDIRISV